MPAVNLVLERMPWSSQILAAEGSLLLGTGRDCEAIGPLEKAVSLDFYFCLAHFNLANAYLSCRSPNQAIAETAITILTTPMAVYASSWRKNPDLLRGALDQSLLWLDSWSDTTPADGEQLRRLAAFLRGSRTAAKAGRVVAKIVLSENVADELTSDPFAYIFRRRTPTFAPTQIELDGLDSGTWAPEGIGKIRNLRPLVYSELVTAYEQRDLDDLMRSLGPTSSKASQ
jgi:hypothetical protein